MPKKSLIDQRIDKLFSSFQPETHEAGPAGSANTDRITSPRSGPRPPRQISMPERHSTLKPLKLFFIFIGIAIVSLGGLVFLLYRQQSVSNPSPQSSFSTTAGAGQNSVATPYPDTEAPSVPRGLAAIAASTTSVKLTWSASSDNVGVIGYTIYRDGVSLGTNPGGDLAFSDESAAPNATYNYALDAFDQAGNHSPVSSPVEVTTPALPGSLTFLLPVADTYVNSASPTSTYGETRVLRADGEPDVHSYLRFEVPDLGGKTIRRVRLMIYTNTGSTRGVRALAVADNHWDEKTTDYANAPALGSELAVAVSADIASWLTMDLTSYITGPGVYSIGIVADSRTAVNMASRESGANAPQLIIDLH